ncbi:MAG: hypothetical protein PHH60_00900 [Candidatus Margulisbacteria bacterium]|nr:hypothetical protein [Candidatus Margulisiibacteriota bacterium]
MPKLVDLLNKNKMTLIVALPKNDLELAAAAVSSGADALLLGLGGKKESLKKVLDKVNVPVGIAINGGKAGNEKEVKEILKLGFDFFTAGLEGVPAYLQEMKRVSRVLSLDSRFSVDALIEISKVKAEALDAAIIPVSGEGKELVVGDLQNYISIVLSAGIPVIIPTQRSIKASEVAIIADTGAKGLLLSAVVIGSDAGSVGKAVREYRLAVDELE